MLSAVEWSGHVSRGIVLASARHMRILLANPNSTEALTEACAVLARRAASPGTLIESWTNREGPPAVDSMYGDYMAGRPLARALADLVQLAGFAPRCAAVRAIELPPIGAPLDAPRVAEALASAIARVAVETGADLVIFGGARLSPFAEAVRPESAMPVLEPVACGVQMAEALVRLGLS